MFDNSGKLDAGKNSAPDDMVRTDGIAKLHTLPFISSPHLHHCILSSNRPHHNPLVMGPRGMLKKFYSDNLLSATFSIELTIKYPLF